LFPFGYGLSYTTFTYRNLSIPAQAKMGDVVQVTVEVENTGAMAGEEVVQLYTKVPGDAPIRSLAGFQRVSLRPHERRAVAFTLFPQQLSHVGADGRRVTDPGVAEIAAGGGQPGFNGRVLTRSLRLR
jgi:beta-glucosidase